MQRNQITPQKDGREGIEPAIPTAEGNSATHNAAERFPIGVANVALCSIGFIVLLIVAALVSEFALRPHFEQVETWEVP